MRLRRRKNKGEKHMNKKQPRDLEPQGSKYFSVCCISCSIWPQEARADSWSENLQL